MADFKRYYLMKWLKRVLCLVLAGIFSLTACDFALPQEFTKVQDRPDEDELFNEAVDAFFEAVDHREAEAIKEMFSPNAQQEDAQLEKRIEQLLAFYPGPTERCERDGAKQGSYSTDYGKRRSEVSDWFAVVCNGTNYYCDFSLVYECDEDADEIGIRYITIASEKAICAENFKFPEESGMHIFEDASGDYQTARIGGYPRVYIPSEQNMTEEDILTFLEEDTTFEALKEAFGEPNAELVPYASYAYELADEEGEKRYADIYVDNRQDGWPITKVTIVNDVSNIAISTLWGNPDR